MVKPIPVDLLPTPEEIRGVYGYDPETGLLTWLASNERHKAGDVACRMVSTGYRVTSLNCLVLRAHRVAFCWWHGAWPTDLIDHINGVKNDNRIANLRQVNQAENVQNILRLRATNTSGFVGAKPKGKRWEANIAAYGSGSKYLGVYDTPEEAHEAYMAAKRRLHPKVSQELIPSP